MMNAKVKRRDGYKEAIEMLIKYLRNKRAERFGLHHTLTEEIYISAGRIWDRITIEDEGSMFFYGAVETATGDIYRCNSKKVEVIDTHKTSGNIYQPQTWITTVEGEKLK